MTSPFIIPPVEVREIEDPETHRLGMEMFSDKVTAERFVEIIRTLREKGFELNGLHSRDWTIGRKALYFGARAPLEALEDAGYNFAADSWDMVKHSKTQWQGSLHRLVATAAHRFDTTIAIPSLPDEARAEAAEMQTPSLRGLTGVVRWVPPKEGRGPDDQGFGP